MRAPTVTVPPVPQRATNAHHAPVNPAELVLWWRHLARLFTRTRARH